MTLDEAVERINSAFREYGYPNDVVEVFVYEPHGVKEIRLVRSDDELTMAMVALTLTNVFSAASVSVPREVKALRGWNGEHVF